MMENFHQVQNSINEILQHMWTKLEILQVQNSDCISQTL
nr:MAG TPA: RNA polymerase II subunit [Caudoviricetes sp.]